MPNQSIRRGISLLETLLSVSIIVLLAGMAAPVYFSFQVRNDLDVTQVSIAQTLRRAQILAQAVDGDSAWGLKVQPGALIMFKGINFSSRDPSFDEQFDVAASVTPAGVDEIVFSKVSGDPTVAGVITLAGSSGDTRSLTITDKGTITY